MTDPTWNIEVEPAADTCPECGHPQTGWPNRITGRHHYKHCSRNADGLDRAARHKAAMRHRHEIEDRQHGVDLPRKASRIADPGEGPCTLHGTPDRWDCPGCDYALGVGA